MYRARGDKLAAGVLTGPGCRHCCPCRQSVGLVWVGAGRRSAGSTDTMARRRIAAARARGRRRWIAVVQARAIHSGPGQCCGPVVDIVRTNNLSG